MSHCACIPLYAGMSWWQGVLTVFVGNVITLVPMCLNAHPGTKYGIPFPVLARASFGIKVNKSVGLLYCIQLKNLRGDRNHSVGTWSVTWHPVTCQVGDRGEGAAAQQLP
eukprot:GHUV01037341.1.p4 GENE.GHUV01037341.1~~GHUV01037341.1.p4  ORF type:complete len:110 (-),score=10.58 GHUV01037341.1:745-1074(-)